MRDRQAAKGLRRGELARRTGANLETVRYSRRWASSRRRHGRRAATAVTTGRTSGVSVSCSERAGSGFPLWKCVRY